MWACACAAAEAEARIQVSDFEREAGTRYTVDTLAALLAREPEWNGRAPPTTGNLLSAVTVNGAVAAQVAAYVVDAGQVGVLHPVKITAGQIKQRGRAQLLEQ